MTVDDFTFDTVDVVMLTRQQGVLGADSARYPRGAALNSIMSVLTLCAGKATIASPHRSLKNVNHRNRDED